MIDNMTNGVQNIICAKSIVTKPFVTASAENNISRLIAVTMSGFMTGNSLMRSVVLRKSFPLFDSPMAVIVPKTVATAVEMTAMMMVYQIELIIVGSLNIFSYHCSEKPSKTVSERLPLNENTMM